MTLSRADAADRPQIEAFLRGHEASSVFPLANLRAGPQAQQIWCARAKDGLQGVIALGQTGFLMPQWPGLDPGAVVKALHGQRIFAVIGPSDQVDPLIDALSLTPRHISREPLCRLDLADLILPDPQGAHLAPIRAQDAEAAVAFRMDYDIETLTQPPDTARAKAESDVARWLTGDSHRLLWRGGVPVALTGLNAKLPDVVQVGGVFVPPVLRGQGLARRAVALHLAEARAAGAQRAVLFAANAPALRAYTAIGFTQIGWMTLALLEKPMVLS